MFTKEDIEKIKGILGSHEAVWETDHYRIKVIQIEEKRTLVLEIYPDTASGEGARHTDCRLYRWGTFAAAQLLRLCRQRRTRRSDLRRRDGESHFRTGRRT